MHTKIHTQLQHIGGIQILFGSPVACTGRTRIKAQVATTSLHALKAHKRTQQCPATHGYSRVLPGTPGYSRVLTGTAAAPPARPDPPSMRGR